MKESRSFGQTRSSRSKQSSSVRKRAYLSNRARRQNRNPDGTFAKGFRNNPNHGCKNRTTSIKKNNLMNLNDSQKQKYNNPDSKTTDRVFEKKMDGFNISIIGTQDEFKTIGRQIKRNFDKKELTRVSKDGIVIKVMDLSSKGKKILAGRYCYEKDKSGREQILIDEDAVNDQETVTHEMVHLCRNKDPNRRGLQRSLMETVNGNRVVKDENLSLEEALTVAETITKTGPTPVMNQNGYYSRLGEKGDKIDERTAKQYK